MLLRVRNVAQEKGSGWYEQDDETRLWHSCGCHDALRRMWGVSTASAEEAVATPTDLTTDVTLLVNGTSDLPENIKLKAVKLASYTSAVTDAGEQKVSSYDLWAIGTKNGVYSAC